MRYLLIALTAAIGSCCVAQSAFRTLFVTNNTTGTVSSMRVHDDGSVSLIATFPSGANPQDLGLSADGRNLVVVNATIATIEEVYTFIVNSDGTLTQSGPPATVGDGPLSIDVTRSDYVLVPSATDDTVKSFRLQSDSLTLVDTEAAGAFPTKVQSTLDSKFAFVAGSASGGYVMKYAIHPDGTLTSIGSATSFPEGSTQGMAVHPFLPTLYVSTALGNVVKWCRIEANGELSVLGAQNAGGNSCVEILAHPSGRWLYVCNVVSDTLTVLSIGSDGSLSATGQTYTIGNDIRSVMTDGRFVFVTDESSIGGSPVGVVVFRVESNGSLTRMNDATPTGGGRPQQMAIWNPSERAAPDSFRVNAGVHIGGGLDQVLMSDDTHLVVEEGPPISILSPSVAIEFTGTVPSPGAYSLTFRIESHCSALPGGGAPRSISLYNYRTGAWSLFDIRPPTLPDSPCEVFVGADAPDYIEAKTRKVRAKAEWFDSGSLLSPGWRCGIDHVEWRIGK